MLFPLHHANQSAAESLSTSNQSELGCSSSDFSPSCASENIASLPSQCVGCNDISQHKFECELSEQLLTVSAIMYASTFELPFYPRKGILEKVGRLGTKVTWQVTVVAKFEDRIAAICATMRMNTQSTFSSAPQASTRIVGAKTRHRDAVTHACALEQARHLDGAYEECS